MERVEYIKRKIIIKEVLEENNKNKKFRVECIGMVCLSCIILKI